jgi:hypothetical protein
VNAGSSRFVPLDARPSVNREDTAVKNEHDELRTAPTGDDKRTAKLSLKEIRNALGPSFKPIITVDEAAQLARLAVKTIQKKVSEGQFKQSVKRGRPLLFWTDRFVQELMR